jgi:hypothetical protein
MEFWHIASASLFGSEASIGDKHQSFWSSIAFCGSHDKPWLEVSLGGK